LDARPSRRGYKGAALSIVVSGSLRMQRSCAVGASRAKAIFASAGVFQILTTETTTCTVESEKRLPLKNAGEYDVPVRGSFDSSGGSSGQGTMAFDGVSTLVQPAGKSESCKFTRAARARSALLIASLGSVRLGRRTVAS